MSDSSQVRVKVALRVRPLNSKERAASPELCLGFVDNQPQVIATKPGGSKSRPFTFDYVYSPEVSQEKIYNDCVKPLVECCFEGFNSTILAYGQTGSGKTFTMGSAVGSSEISEEEKGMIPRVIERIFSRIEELKGEGKDYIVKVSFLELYNEDIKDMFCPEVSPKAFMIREDKQNGIYVTGITESEVKTPQQMINVLMVGSLYRTTAATEMNANSSRSHAIFTIILKEVKSNITSKLHFVDLAGSERLARTKAEGSAMKEGISINSGLLALGNVINALGDTKRKTKHIPYRDSKLTRILQDSLGGNSQTLMIACASPAVINYDETVNTLKYADRARQIKNRPVIVMDPVGLELAALRQQIVLLKAQLVKYKRGDAVDPEEGEDAKEQADKRLTGQGNDLDEEILRLRKENRELKAENQRLESSAKEMKEALLDAQVSQDLRVIYQGETVDQRVEDALRQHRLTIQEYQDKLSKSDSELSTFKNYSPEYNIPQELEGLTYELDNDFNLQFSASTQKILDELSKNALFEFHHGDDDEGELEEGIVEQKYDL